MLDRQFDLPAQRIGARRERKLFDHYSVLAKSGEHPEMRNLEFAIAMRHQRTHIITSHQTYGDEIARQRLVTQQIDQAKDSRAAELFECTASAVCLHALSPIPIAP